jgi:hypothetical protein
MTFNCRTSTQTLPDSVDSRLSNNGLFMIQLLVVCRTHITDRRVEPLTIVETLDVIEEVASGLREVAALVSDKGCREVKEYASL